MEKPIQADYEIARENAENLWKAIGFKHELSGPIPDVRDGWPCIKFILCVKGESFEYRLGTGHAKNLKRASRTGSPWVFKISDDEKVAADYMARGVDLKDKALMARVACKCFDKKDAPTPSLIISYVSADADAHDLTFEEWCGNYGYETDSIKARNTYDECVLSWHKLRKIGINMEEITKFSELCSRF